MTIADHALLDDLHDELGRGRIFECSLRDPKWHLDGLQDGDTIYIDPRPAILETLVHELIHRRHRRWGERRVMAVARRLIAAMTEDDKARWWRNYSRTKRKSTPIEVEE